MTDHLQAAPGLGHDEAAAWLPGGRRGEAARRWWRGLAEMVEALAERYPRQLAALPDDWWRWPDLAEQLGALAAWRSELDAGHVSHRPEGELEYHEKLERMREVLDERAEAVLLENAQHPRAPREPAEPRGRRPRRVAALEEALLVLGEQGEVPPGDDFAAPYAGRPGDVNSAERGRSP